MIRLTHRRTGLALALLAVGIPAERAEAQVVGSLGRHADGAGGGVESRAVPSPDSPPPRGVQGVGTVGSPRDARRVLSREISAPNLLPVPPG